METKTWSNYRLSRLMLGTVQFGMPYGVANRTGQPDYNEARAIVSAALEGGVNCFDTAAAYGSSEEVLGRALHDLGVADRVVVVTKVRSLTPEEKADSSLSAAAIERSVAESRRRLQLDCLPIVLFHSEADGAFLDALERMKTRGWLKHAGVSCDNRPGPAATFAAQPAVEAMQIPASILDQRHQRAGSLAAAAKHGVAVFIRSVYLQGLMLMPENTIPDLLQGVIPVRRRLEAIAQEAGITLAELAVRYMLAQEGVTCLLTGVETVAQLRENVALFKRGPLPAPLIAAIDTAVPELPEMLLTPSMWKQYDRFRRNA